MHVRASIHLHSNRDASELDIPWGPSILSPINVAYSCRLGC